MRASRNQRSGLKKSRVGSLATAAVTLFAIATVVLAAGQACSSALPADTSALAATTESSDISPGSNSSLTLTPSLMTVPYGGTLQLTASGGTAPYNYYVVSGTGSITASGGLYSAPSTSVTVNVGVTDAVGARAYGVIMVASATSSITLSGTYSKVINGSFATLNTYNGACSSAAPYGDGCNLAIHLYCQANGYGTGFGPVEFSGDLAIITCLINGSTTPAQVAYVGLAVYQPTCTAATPFSSACNSAQSRYCTATHAASGFGPITHDATYDTVECVSTAAETYLTVSFGVLTNEIPTCTAANTVSTDCLSAVFRYCKSQGYVSGYGVVEVGGGNAGINCTK